MSSVENEGESDCSSTSSRNRDISSTGCLKKFKQSNISIKDFKIMLVNGLSKAKKEAVLPSEENKNGTFSLVRNSASIDNDIISSKCNPISDSASAGVEFDDKSSIDENSFELRIDDEDEFPENKLNLKSDRDSESKKNSGVNARSKNVGHKLLLPPNVDSSEKVLGRSILSTDLENINIPEISNNDEDSVDKNLTAASPIIASSKTSNSPVIEPQQTKFNCSFCEKQFWSKNSLKFHVLSHLKVLKKDARDNGFVPTSEIDDVAAKNIDNNASFDFVCVLCEKSFSNKMTLTIHYKVHHRTDPQKGSPQSQNRVSVSSAQRGQSSANKIDVVGTGSNITSAISESSTNPNADENCSNEDASKQYKCYICDKQFARNSSLMWHIQFHETYMFSKLKKSNTELENGLSPGGGGGSGGGTGVESSPVDADHPLRCHVCGKTYESQAGYRRHMVTHKLVDEDAESLGEKCEICNKYYPTAVGLKRHIIFMHKDQLPRPPVEDTEDVAIDDGEDSISGSSVSDDCTCNICDRSFTDRNSYKRHMNLVHKLSDVSSSSSMRKYAQKCNKKSVAAPSIAEEGDTSKEPVGDFVCDICQRSFCSQRAVSIHRAHGHRGELSDSVASDTVASDTVTSDVIPCDAYIELKEGLFQCTVCDKTFESRKGVIRHIGYHRSALNAQTDALADDSNDDDDDDEEEEEEEVEEENSIPCPECGKTFRSIRGMRIHANSHRETTIIDEEDDAEDDTDEESESGFECNICGETFERFRSYKVHIGWHRRRGEEAVVARKKRAKTTPKPKLPQSGPGKIHQCQYCPRWYTTQQALAGHMKAHQPEKAATSQADPSRPSSSGGKTSKTSKTYMCQVCGQLFPNTSSLNSHMKSHVEEGFATPTTSSGQLLTLDDTMECDICGKFFMRKQDMAKHMRDHMNGVVTKENVDLKLFQCIYCQKSFVGKKSLNTHQILHEEARVALKRAANEEMTGASPAKQRRPSESAAASQEDLIGWDDMIPTHQCEECDRRLSTKQSLRRHMEWHAKMKTANGSSVPPPKEKNSMTSTAPSPPPSLHEPAGIPFECLYCKKRFRTKDLLVDHTKIHEDLPVGKAPAADADDLEALGEFAVVQSVEGGDEEYFVFEQREGDLYQCSECDESHFDKLQMIVHMAYHVGRRWTDGRQSALVIKVNPLTLAPFECMFCDQRFVNKTFRTRHVLQRHGDGVLHCESCKKVFLTKKKLEVHCRRHFVGSLYRCEHCLKCFTSKWFLKRHTRKTCAGKSSPERKEMMLPKTSPQPFMASPPAFIPGDHKCEFCGLLVNDEEAFLRHLQSHVLKYKCENCDFGCENFLELDSHACIVTTTETVSCGQYDSVFTDGAFIT